MKPASAGSGRQARRFERECERLRPLAEAYLLRRFAGRLGRADAEDVVAEVMIRVHRQARAGRPPRNLRALVLTSARNAAIDLLRARAVRPATVGLEAAAQVPDTGATPTERAEGSEDAARLQEALARMRASYRETLLLRFGLELKISEIAAHFEISEAAAKKRLLRAATQVRKRMAAIDGEEFCPQMRELARGRAFEQRASGLAQEAEAEALRAHFRHCGSCRSFLSRLRGELHDLGSGAAGSLLAGHRLGGRLDVLGRIGHWAGAAAGGVQAAGERLRHLALRAAAPFSSGDGAAGAMMGTGQKIAAACGVGATATATCLLSGAIGPGIGAAVHSGHADQRPAPKVRRLSAQGVSAPPAFGEAPAAGPQETPPASGEEAESSAPQPKHAAEATPPPSTQPAISEAPREASAPSPAPSEFGIEEGSSSGAASSGSQSGAAGSGAESQTPARQAPAAGAGGGDGGPGSAAPAHTGSVGFQG
jgi:RNA polymerase sigma factor (sigma-70 family)